MSSYLDTRELQSELDELRELPALDPETAERLAALEALEGEGIPDWEHGATLIPEDEFEDYARELAEDIGAVSNDHGWPMSHIDWKAAAQALQQDYMAVEFDGTTYLVRA